MKYLSKIIKYGFYLLVFLLPWQTRWIISPGFTEYQTYSLYGTDVLLSALLFLLAIYNFKNFKFTKEIIFFIVGFSALWLIWIFGAADKYLALYKLSWLVLGLGFYWLAVKANYNRFKLFGCLLLSLAGQAILAIWQFLTQSTFANKWLGLALHPGYQAGVSVVETVGADGLGERWLRAYGGFDHPNILGGVMAIAILFLIIHNFQTIFNFKIFKLIRWLLLIVLAAALFFSFSRTAWLALAAGLLFFLVAAFVRRDLPVQKKALEAILVISAVFFIMFCQYSNLIITRLYASGRLEIKSADQRVESLRNSWPIIRDNWLMGVGPGNYIPSLEQKIAGQESYFYQPAHNVFVLVLAELGVVGLILFVLIFFKLLIGNCQAGGWWANLKYLLKGGGENSAMNLAFNLPVLIAMIVLLSLDHWLWSLHFGVLFFWLVMGIVRSEKKKS